MKTIITTVGTSIFTNYRRNNPLSEVAKDGIGKLEMKSWNKDDSERLDGNKVVKAVKDWALVDGGNGVSAEVKSVLKLKDIYKDVSVHLIATDTMLSVLAARVVADILRHKGVDVEFDEKEDVVKGLQVSDARTFEREGIVNLVDRLNYIITSNYYNDVFNITGGYKAIIPYMTVMAQVNNIPIYYIFERTDSLIRIPQAPIDINWAMFEKYADVLERLEEGIEEGWNSYKKRRAIGEDFSDCIWEEDDMAELNAIGKIFWNKYQNFFLVKVVKGSNYFGEKNRKQLERVFRELYERLEERIKGNEDVVDTKSLIEFVNRLGDQDDLRHGRNPDKDKFIFKSTKENQVRLVYSPELNNGRISLKVYDYVMGGGFNHSRYIDDFRKKFSMGVEEDRFTIYPVSRHGFS